MSITFGKYRGRSVAEVVLKDPSYIVWMLREGDPGETLAKVCEEARHLIAIFNGKPIAKKCGGDGCNDTATHLTVYGGNVNTRFWCDNCDPYSAGASPGKLSVVRTYGDAIQHVDWSCGGRKAFYEVLIRTLAQAKGLPERATAKRIGEFFAS